MPVAFPLLLLLPPLLLEAVVATNKINVPKTRRKNISLVSSLPPHNLLSFTRQKREYKFVSVLVSLHNFGTFNSCIFVCVSSSKLHFHGYQFTIRHLQIVLGTHLAPFPRINMDIWR